MGKKELENVGPAECAAIRRAVFAKKCASSLDRNFVPPHKLAFEEYCKKRRKAGRFRLLVQR
jgi:hypothetical protein